MDRFGLLRTLFSQMASEVIYTPGVTLLFHPNETMYADESIGPSISIKGEPGVSYGEVRFTADPDFIRITFNSPFNTASTTVSRLIGWEELQTLDDIHSKLVPLVMEIMKESWQPFINNWVFRIQNVPVEW